MRPLERLLSEGAGLPGLPRILCVVNRPDWAHDRKTADLARALAGRFELVTRYQAEVSAEDLTRADAVLLYYWLQVGQLGPLEPVLRQLRAPVLVGICSHYELEGAWREPGLALLRELPRAIFINNEGLVRAFRPLLERPVYYTPNGVDTDFFRPAARSADRRARLIVGWAGSLTNHGAGHRGVEDYIVPAAAAVEGAELRLAAREQRWRNRDEMLEFYRDLDVYVCASRTEGTPNPAMEAAACGVPVVTTRVGCMPEFITDGENGFFVERDPADIARRLRQLRDDRPLRTRLGQAARATAERWDWRPLAGNYEVMFRDVLGQRPPEGP